LLLRDALFYDTVFKIGGIMNHDTALSKAKEIADRVLVPAAGRNDREGRFSTEARQGGFRYATLLSPSAQE